MRSHYTLPRLYLERSIVGEIELSREQSHYLATVLRRTVGDDVRLFNARDGEWAAEIVRADRRSVTLRVDQRLRDPASVPDIRLIFAPLRKHRTATVIEKATELGVRTLQPVLTARTQFPKINLERARLQMIEAAEQTERLDLPILCKPKKLDTIMSEMADQADRRVLFADEAGEAQPILSVLEDRALPFDILIGPEGGFTDDERGSLRSLPQVEAVSLGPRILRADTAAISVLSVVQAKRGDWS